ncbi:LPS export ABC transporter permease LptF [Phaeovulum vinaykumarii]|uniref:Lipopolysaccharide export system permease protein n=1 Tax=Phaeovulum vinaykumarii TaxID=407234 RepID=A0A1N7K4V2_9RHOB|nr:LPS export ABC transporter permease LptF [Phaeovulum vinaykumarii]SIS56464.1 lipopolysaccharide export system permease protein [Phaeovulum vinaykumarii]SOB92884.1 lipopolysaccharide export system permease protein [Phaeovulum vinaykumarii]
MSRIDRYLIAQLLALFGFFALVLVSVYWVNTTARLFDRMIADGQSAMVVLEFTAMMLPGVILLVLPVAVFAATLYGVNRLMGDSELVVMQATGISPWRMARGVAGFGLIVALAMGMLAHELVPISRARLAERQAQVSQNISARILVEGRFIHPASGVTLYIGQISPLGELLEVFISDNRAPDTETTYTAQKAVVVKTETGPRLVMFEGMVQDLAAQTGRLQVTRFDTLTYDIGALMGAIAPRRPRIEEFTTPQLIAHGTAVAHASGAGADLVRTILHERIAQPLLAPVGALLGLAALLTGGFSRFGIWRQIGFAILLAIGVQFLVNLTSDMARGLSGGWPLVYAPAVAGLLAAAALLGWGARRRRVPPPARSAADGSEAGA